MGESLHLPGNLCASGVSLLARPDDPRCTVPLVLVQARFRRFRPGRGVVVLRGGESSVQDSAEQQGCRSRLG